MNTKATRYPEITSLQNNRIKHVVKLQSRRFRDRVEQTVVEGVRECRLALQNGYVPLFAYACRSVADTDDLDGLLSELEEAGTSIVEVSEAVFAKMAYRKKTGGLLIVLPYWQHDLTQFTMSTRPFLAVIEHVEKPGNLGAILRSADAAGVDGVIVCSTLESNPVDLYNPNAIRASLGAIFTRPVFQTSTHNFLSWAKARRIQIVVATPDASQRYTAVDFTQATAVVTGSEAHGVSEQMRAEADVTAVIPMNGQVDSLNLSVSTAILLYEALRQRTF